MSNTIKIILMVIFFIINVLLIIMLIIPNLSANAIASASMEMEREEYKFNIDRLNELLLMRDEYNTLNAEYQKYSMHYT